MSKGARALVSFVAGAIMFVWFFPFAGTDDDPPHHFNVFTREIPNDDPLIALVVGLAVGSIVWTLLGTLESRRRSSRVDQ